MARELVLKSYQVVTARAQLTANEQNILTLLVMALKKEATNIRESIKRERKQSNLPALSDSEITIPDERVPTEFMFSLSELSDIMGVTSSALSRTLDETTDSLIKRDVRWSLPGKGFRKAPLVTLAEYCGGKLRIDIRKETANAILDETRGYSEVDLRLAFTLRGGYDKRILDMISRDKREYFECSFEAFQEMLGTTIDEYSRGLAGFRKVVLDEPLKRIFKASNGTWEPTDDKGKGYELVKEGRKVKKIIFTVQYNDPKVLRTISDIRRDELKAEKEGQEPMQQPYEFTLPGMEDKIRTFTKMTDAVNMHLVAYEAMANLQGHKIPAEIVCRMKILRK